MMPEFMNAPRPEPRSLHGVLLLDKASGFSSNSSLQKAKRLLRARKAGHTGSLDPIASGLLPICLGEATKFSGFLLNTDKRYWVRVKLGIETDTADIEGSVTRTLPVPELSEALIETALATFRGDGFQIPPMYSALKHQGRRLYELARKGIEVERALRPITIHDLRLERYDADTLDLDVHCSKGTYIRTLAEDLGRVLGCGGHVEILRRTAVGQLGIDQAYTIGQLEAMTDEARTAVILPVETLVADLPKVQLTADVHVRVRRGDAVFVPQAPTAGSVRLYGPESSFIGVGEVLDDGHVAPRRLIKAS
jgi:tRNA pseudouridine55 synthase